MFHCHYLKNEKHSLECLLDFPNLHKIFWILKKKISCIAEIFRKLFTTRNVVT